MDNEREEAVEILLCIADLHESAHPDRWETTGDLVADNALAREAWYEIAFDGTTQAEDALEAAALVADGWNPGDPVEGMPS